MFSINDKNLENKVCMGEQGMLLLFLCFPWIHFPLDILKGHISFERDHNKKTGQQSLSAQLDALVDMKFTYVISCQEFGNQKSCGDPHAQDIIDLMIRYALLFMHNKYMNLKLHILFNLWNHMLFLSLTIIMIIMKVSISTCSLR